MPELKILLGFGEAGKTAYAEKYFKEEEILRFDNFEPYGSSEKFENSMRWLAKVCNRCGDRDLIMDGYLYILNDEIQGKNFTYFKNLLEHHTIKPIVIFTDAETIVNRVLGRQNPQNKSPDNINKGFIVNFYEKLRESFNFSNAKFYHAIDGEFKPVGTYDRVTEIVSGVKEEDVKALLNRLSKIIPEEEYGTRYDPYYQTIQLPFGYEITGYGKDCQFEIGTWNQIKKSINWKDKSIADIGCLNGYFSFKIKNMQAKEVVGYDLFRQSCEIGKEIAKLKCLDVDFKIFDANKDMLPKEYDVILLLNTLHHLSNPEYCLNEIFEKGKHVILEVQFKEFHPSIQRGGYKRIKENVKNMQREDVFKIAEKHNHYLVEEVESCRPYRTILHYKKK